MEEPVRQQATASSYSFSPGFVPRLARLGLSIAFTSYQSGLLYMLGAGAHGGANLHQSAMPKPMGLAFDGRQLVLAGGWQILRFAQVLKPGERANETYDACFVPRRADITGSLDAHDIGIAADGEPVFVNTRFNCLARPDACHSFVPLWRPPFITALVDEDRCHLNGLAMENGKPAFVTAVSRSDTIDGWRDRRMAGGVAMTVGSGEVVCEGLSMPHSPRVHNGELWLLNSGTGDLGVVRDGRFVARAFCPGFLRGLRLHAGLAFVGLSKPRYSRFEGLALDERLKAADSEAWCGIQVIDLSSGSCVDWFRIDGPVSELYDLEILPGIACPMTVSPGAVESASLITLPLTS